MRRNVCRHAHSNTAGTVDEHVWETGRQNRWFAVFAVIIVLEINGVFVDVGQKEGGRFVHPHFGVAHRSGVIAIHGAKVTLTIQKGQRHRKILRHPHKCFVNRAVAVGVVLTHDIANRTGRFAVGFIVRIIGFVHRIKNAAMDGF